MPEAKAFGDTEYFALCAGVRRATGFSPIHSLQQMIGILIKSIDYRRVCLRISGFTATGYAKCQPYP